jgi:hypothetical protein
MPPLSYVALVVSYRNRVQNGNVTGGIGGVHRGVEGIPTFALHYLSLHDRLLSNTQILHFQFHTK